MVRFSEFYPAPKIQKNLHAHRSPPKRYFRWFPLWGEHNFPICKKRKKEKKNSLAFWKSAIVKVIRRTSLWAVGKFAVTNLTNLPYKGNPKKPITTRSAPQKSLPMRVIHTRNFFILSNFFILNFMCVNKEQFRLLFKYACLVICKDACHREWCIKRLCFRQKLSKYRLKKYDFLNVEIYRKFCFVFRIYVS